MNPMAVITPDAIVEVNEPCLTLLGGYKRQDLLGRSPSTPMTPESARLAERRLAELKAGNPPENCHVYDLVRRDGSTVSVEVSSISWPGDCLLVVTILKDVTNREREVDALKKAEKALRKSEARYKSIVENTADVIMLTRPDASIAYLSPACKAVLGYDPEELVEGNGVRIFHADDRELIVATLQKALRGESGSGFEYRIVTKRGEIKWLSHTWSPIIEGGRVEMVVSVVRDITEWKTRERELHRAHADLARAYELQREFLNNITHEVRTPLTAVKGYVQMLLEGGVGTLTDEQRSLLRKVLTNSESLMEIVNDVLEIVRLKSGMTALRPQVCSPRTILGRAVLAVLPEAKRKGLTISVDCPPNGGEGVYDQGKLAAVLTNLLSNAVKFTEEGTIEAMAASDTSGAEIVVVDTGVGINAQDLDRVFDEFQQFDQPRKHKPSGFGLGLAIVATMVESMGATLIVSSRKGVGTAFTLIVPSLDT